MTKSLTTLLICINLFFLFFITFGFTYIQLNKEEIKENEAEIIIDSEVVNSKQERFGPQVFGIVDKNPLVNQSASSKPPSIPLALPSKGIVALTSSPYTQSHGGIDIFTTKDGKGIDGRRGGKGNQVIASCDGKITNIKENNGEIVLTCNDKELNKYSDILPSTRIALIYAHMADAEKNEIYYVVKKNQTVKRGDLIGYQGNKSSFVPINRWVHLHFGVMNLNGYKFIDPSPYFGLKSIPVGYVFK